MARYQSKHYVGGQMKSVLFMLCIFLSLNILAKEEVLAVVTNNDNTDIYKIILVSDDTTGDVKGFYKDNFSGNKKVARTSLDYKALDTNTGLVLEQRNQYRVIALQSHNFEKQSGGIIGIDTLYNGANGQRKTYELSLAKDRAGWKLFKGNTLVSKLHIEVNKVAMLGTVGIKNIRME